MTIQVYFEDRLVGELQGANPEAAEVAFIEETASTLKHGPDVASMSSMLWLPTSRRLCEVALDRIEKLTGRAEMTIREARKIHRIPDYAESETIRMESIPSDRIRFSWNVLCPTLDQYETLFDSPKFKPL
jgi:hypothetical protein